MSKSAKLDLGEKQIELPIIEGSEGERAVDISKLRAETGFITMDNGFGNSGSCESKITFIDGEKGILKHRGYTIENLSEKSSFLELAYLLFNQKLPSADELTSFKGKITERSRIPEGIKALIKSFPKEAHPMSIASAAMVALSAHYPELTDQDLNDSQKNEIFPLLLGQFKTIAAAIYRHGQGESFVDPDPSLDYTADFLYMMKGKQVNPEIAKALDVLLILHADHEQNCSAATVRVVGSSKANLFASLSAGIDALWGPLHGGANQAVLEMLEAIQKDGGGYEKFISKAKDKEDPFRLMGFGHRVYKNFDPRAKVIKSYCDEVLEALETEDPLLDIAKGLEKTALSDEYFVSRKLFPNVDFYSGIIYKALGIPTNMFTVMFALGRQPGWMSQWRELVESPAMRITRPRQIYQGKTDEKL
ncbi:MAG: citrate (Si)-synthase [Halobacteriovoraceae bacterium]|nr:citrate (Si)-synthase [Halobacteriovoraceae bacterium]|tara:strand:- start:22464 stop:23720 length:1257 start_codon:yes stop_codon:yes gene_type:complete